MKHNYPALKRVLSLVVAGMLLAAVPMALTAGEAPEETAAARALAEVVAETNPNRAVSLSVSYNGLSDVANGDTVTLIAKLSGYEGLAYTVYWQYYAETAAEDQVTFVWTTEDGKTGPTYPLCLSRANYSVLRRAKIVITGVPGYAGETTGTVTDYSDERPAVLGELAARTMEEPVVEQPEVSAEPEAPTPEAQAEEPAEIPEVPAETEAPVELPQAEEPAAEIPEAPEETEAPAPEAQAEEPAVIPEVPAETEAPIEEVQAEEPAEEIPETPAETEAPAPEVQAEEPAAETPEAPAQEVQAEEPAADIPEVPAETEAPVQEPQAEAPVTLPIGETIDITHPDRSVSVSVSWAGDTVGLGDAVTLTAALHGYDGVEARVDWQYDAGNGVWQDAGTGMSFTFTLSLENYAWNWRAVAVPLRYTAK